MTSIKLLAAVKSLFLVSFSFTITEEGQSFVA